MASYILLVNWTDQGIRNVKESPERLAGAKKSIEAAGGKMKLISIVGLEFSSLLIPCQ